MVYYVHKKSRKLNIAGSKAPDDIAKICDKLGFTSFPIPQGPDLKGLRYKLWVMVTMSWYILRMLVLLGKRDTIIMQHPSYGYRILLRVIPHIRKLKKCRFIVVIHDLESLRESLSWDGRGDEKKSFESDNRYLKVFDRVISHNKYMTEYLVKETGIPKKRIVNLEIFDYLSDAKCQVRPRSELPSVAIAGALHKWKCGYLYKMPEKDLTVHLYGIGFEEDQAKDNMIYHGSFKPEELPSHLEGDFGLVWDGDSASGCSGSLGNYLRYNNPHKASLYLASFMPVIVWKESAMADFILDHGLGLAVDSLDEISQAIRSLSPEEYEDMMENVKEEAGKLRRGYYFSRAINSCLSSFRMKK